MQDEAQVVAGTFARRKELVNWCSSRLRPSFNDCLHTYDAYTYMKNRKIPRVSVCVFTNHGFDVSHEYVIKSINRPIKMLWYRDNITLDIATTSADITYLPAKQSKQTSKPNKQKKKNNNNNQHPSQTSHPIVGLYQQELKIKLLPDYPSTKTRIWILCISAGKVVVVASVWVVRVPNGRRGGYCFEYLCVISLALNLGEIV